MCLGVTIATSHETKEKKTCLDPSISRPLPRLHSYTIIMEALEGLRTSLVQAINESTARVCDQLTKELASRDASIQELEHQVNLAHELRQEALTRLEALQHELSLDSPPLKRQEDATLTGCALCEKYDPQHFPRSSDPNELADRYKAMFGDLRKLADAYDHCKPELERQKRKLRYWQHHVQRSEFSIMLDTGHLVTFRRVQDVDAAGVQLTPSISWTDEDRPHRRKISKPTRRCTPVTALFDAEENTPVRNAPESPSDKPRSSRKVHTMSEAEGRSSSQADAPRANVKSGPPPKLPTIKTQSLPISSNRPENQPSPQQELYGSTQDVDELESATGDRQTIRRPLPILSRVLRPITSNSRSGNSTKRKAAQDSDRSTRRKSNPAPETAVKRANVNNNEGSSSSNRKRIPLRRRPVEELSRSDFKINPANNGGVDFPYVAVVRTKAERKRLAPCVDEKCCGPVFREMALSLPCPEDEYRRTMKEYLGYEAHIVDEIEDDAEREKLFIEARTWYLAKRYGRHKANWTRPVSPPGFWRTDMPDTQQVQRDNEEADRQERAVILERRRDAMRPDGVWMFADE